MAQAQLNFHISAEKIKSQEQKKLLFEVFLLNLLNLLNCLQWKPDKKLLELRRFKEITAWTDPREARNPEDSAQRHDKRAQIAAWEANRRNHAFLRKENRWVKLAIRATGEQTRQRTIAKEQRNRQNHKGIWIGSAKSQRGARGRFSKENAAKNWRS